MVIHVVASLWALLTAWRKLETSVFSADCIWFNGVMAVAYGIFFLLGPYRQKEDQQHRFVKSKKKKKRKKKKDRQPKRWKKKKR